MKELLPRLVTTTGALLGSLYGYRTVLAADLPTPAGFLERYQNYYFSILLPIIILSGWWISQWRADQIEPLHGWRKWTAQVLLSLIAALLGYGASFAAWLFPV